MYLDYTLRDVMDFIDELTSYARSPYAYTSLVDMIPGEQEELLTYIIDDFELAYEHDYQINFVDKYPAFKEWLINRGKE